MGKCTFNILWLKQPEYKLWLAPAADKYKAYCTFCAKEIQLGKMGDGALQKHLNGKKHISLVKGNCSMSTVMRSFFKPENTDIPTPSLSINDGLILSTSSPEVSTSASASSSCASASSSSLSVFSHKLPVIGNAVLDAEIRWSVKCVLDHYSYNSCKDISVLFQDMFPDSKIAEQFTCGPTKCAYLTCFGIAPYYENLLYDKLNNCENFVLLFDESLNQFLQNKQLDIHVRYWHESKQEVQTSYLTSLFLGHATAEVIFTEFNESLKKLNLEKVIQLSMDGPAVNWKFYSLLQQKMKNEFKKGLLDLGSCALHIVNNSFKHGCAKSEWELDAFLSALYYLFKDSPARREDFLALSQSKKMPIKFCKHRWLENLPASERALEILEEVKDYVTNVEKGTFYKPSSKSFSVVQQACKDKLISVKLNFFIAISKIIYPFQIQYQHSKPMFPFMPDDLRIIISNILITFNIVKKEIKPKLNNTLQVSQLNMKDPAIYACESKISVGFVGDLLIKNLLFKKAVSEKDVFNLKCQVKEFCIEVIQNLLQKSPLKYTFVRCLSSIDPRHMGLNSTDCETKMKNILVHLSKAGFILAEDCDSILMEYTSFFSNVVSKIPDEFLNFDPHDNDTKLDCFLNKHLNQKPYLKIWKVIKLLLVLSHGQADVERGFSFNRQLEVENLSEKSLIAQRIIVEHLKKNGQKIEINKQLRLSAASARQKYLAYLDERKRIKENETKSLKRKSMLEEVADIKSKKAQLEASIKNLEAGADRLAEKAEESGNLQYIIQSNSFRRSVKDKKVKLADTEKQLDSLLKELKNSS